MKSKKFMHMVISGIMVGSILFSSTSMVFAKDINNRSDSPTINYAQDIKGIKKDGMKTQPDRAVIARNTTPDQKPAVDKPITPPVKDEYKDHLDAFVAAGTITFDQKVAIENALKPLKDQNPNLKVQLDALVAAGIITPNQMAILLNAMIAPAK